MILFLDQYAMHLDALRGSVIHLVVEGRKYEENERWPFKKNNRLNIGKR